MFFLTLGGGLFFIYLYIFHPLGGEGVSEGMEISILFFNSSLKFQN